MLVSEKVPASRNRDNSGRFSEESTPPSRKVLVCLPEPFIEALDAYGREHGTGRGKSIQALLEGGWHLLHHQHRFQGHRKTFYAWNWFRDQIPSTSSSVHATTSLTEDLWGSNSNTWSSMQARWLES